MVTIYDICQTYTISMLALQALWCHKPLSRQLSLSSQQSLVDKGLLLEGNLTPDHTYMAPHPNQPPKLMACWYFNCNTCRRPDCKFAHCCEHCGANHTVKKLCQIRLAFPHPLNLNHGLQYDLSYLNVN